MEYSGELVFFVNGEKVVETDPDPSLSLLHYLRRHLKLCGSKEGCGVGGCGACTVMLSKYDRDNDKVIHIAVNACLTPVCSVHGLAVTTVEGIGSVRTKLHSVQERLALSHGSQCGFCTPGIIMSMYSLLRTNSQLTERDIEESLQGNLCRCTGYRPIMEGLKTFTENWKTSCEINSMNSITTGCNRKDCCKLNKNNENSFNSDSSLTEWSRFKPYDPSQELIFPPELMLTSKFDKQYLRFSKHGITWFRPNSLVELVNLKSIYPQAKIVVGNTEIGVEIKFCEIYPMYIHPKGIPELYKIERGENSLIVGASTSLSDFRSALKTEIDSNPTHKTRVFKELYEMLHWFAGKQIRNVACIAGNIVTSSPISDLAPIFLASRIGINLLNKDRGHRKIILDNSFFVSYRKNILKSDDLIVSIEIPHSKEGQYMRAYKQAKRREDDISIVTAAFILTLQTSDVIDDIKICFGGMADKTLELDGIEARLKGKIWNEDTVGSAIDDFVEELKLPLSAPGGMIDYRRTLAISMFFKFSNFVFESMKSHVVKHINEENNFQEGCYKSSQYFEIKESKHSKWDTVGQPVPHASASKQVTGEAVYCDDIPNVEGQLYLCLLLSKKAHAKILNIDASQALIIPGVVTFFSAKDLEKDKNIFGFGKDEEVFTSEYVTSFGNVLGAIVATGIEIARAAVKKIKVDYEELPIIITIEDAIAQNSYFSNSKRSIRNGDVHKALTQSMQIVTGSCHTGAQEHFYLEPQAAFALPREDMIEIYSTTQHPAEISMLVSHLMNLPQHKIISKVKRIGGGFGGKETRTYLIALPVSFAAYKLKKPVRAVLDRSEDMQITGYRNPFYATYEAGFNNDGRINCLIVNFYLNGGCSLDLSGLVVERVLATMDNAYNIPNILFNGQVCKTNLPSNTAFRGFGTPQAMLTIETIMRHVASTNNMSYEEVAKLNMYTQGDLTHNNQLIERCTLSRCWDECINSSEYWKRKEEIKQFNMVNRWHKKGISIVPTKFGVTFGTNEYMQASAYILIYQDGSVLLTIGGIEMGQGLYTKMIQIASKVLDIDISLIHINEMSTDKIANSVPTAASISSDLYGMAVIDACSKLKKRLSPYKEMRPDDNWSDWTLAAYKDRVNLSATGFYKAKLLTYDLSKNEGRLFEYFTYGVAASEIIIDCLTGDHKVIRTDIVMDVGDSLNPAIDVGQIEGAFLQGYGMYTMEEILVTPKGRIITNGPGNYKIPTLADIPREFNVSLLKGAPNPRAVYASKAIGEPPLSLAASVYFALKEAIKSARFDAGVDPEFEMSAPATCEKIRMACVDEITKKIEETKLIEGQPWCLSI